MNEIKNNKTEYLKEINSRIYEQLTYAETKNGVMLGLLTAVFGVIVGVLSSAKGLNIYLILYLIFVGVCLIIALSACLISFFPNLEKLGNTESKNLYFYGDISTFNNINMYEEEINSTPCFDEHIEAQNIHVSKIVMRKNKCFIVSMHAIFLGLIPPVYVVYLIVKRIQKNKKK